jgi:hypothetical protein
LKATKKRMTGKRSKSSFKKDKSLGKSIRYFRPFSGRLSI